MIVNFFVYIIAVSNKHTHMATKQFIYQEAVEKQTAREIVLSHIPKNCKKVLTLSAENFKFENMVLNSRHSKNAVIDSYEYKESVYNEGVKNFKKLKKENKERAMNFFLGDIYKVDFKLYDFINLDLCGTFTIEFINRIIASLQGFKGTIFITLTKNPRNTLLRKNLDVYGAKSMEDFRDNVFPKILKDYCNLDMIIEPVTYANKSLNNKAGHMILFGFKNVA